MKRRREAADRRGTCECRFGHLATDGGRVEAGDGDVVEGDDDVDHLHRERRDPREVGAVGGTGRRKSDGSLGVKDLSPLRTRGGVPVVETWTT